MLGALLWLPVKGNLSTSPDLRNIAIVLLALFLLLSLTIALVGAYRQRSAINTTADGLIYGVTTSYSILILLTTGQIL